MHSALESAKKGPAGTEYGIWNTRISVILPQSFWCILTGVSLRSSYNLKRPLLTLSHLQQVQIEKKMFSRWCCHWYAAAAAAREKNTEQDDCNGKDGHTDEYGKEPSPLWPHCYSNECGGYTTDVIVGRCRVLSSNAAGHQITLLLATPLGLQMLPKGIKRNKKKKHRQYIDSPRHQSVPYC